MRVEVKSSNVLLLSWSICQPHQDQLSTFRFKGNAKFGRDLVVSDDHIDVTNWANSGGTDGYATPSSVRVPCRTDLKLLTSFSKTIKRENSSS